MTTLRLSWEQVDSAVRLIAKTFHASKIDGIYGIPRGGLVPAVMLSHRMKKPLLLAPTDKCLIIDDIYDTGQTLDQHRQKGRLCAAICWNGERHLNPNGVVSPIRTDGSWTNFPWELSD